MKRAREFILANYYIDHNKFGKPYTVLTLFNTDFLLFVDLFMGDNNNHGVIVIRDVLTNKLKNIGNWSKSKDTLELRIKGKGVYYANNKSEFTFNITEAIPETKKDHRIVKLYKTITENSSTRNKENLELVIV